MEITLIGWVVRAIKSPQLLELSGIGDPDILKPLGIPCEVELPAVGTNAQEHIMYATSYGTTAIHIGGGY
jgi:choline dehydrogenase-like flavoprotein